jgi:plastocyanin
MKTKLIVGFFALVIIFGGYYFYDQQKNKVLAPTTEDSLENSSAKSESSSEEKQSPETPLTADALKDAPSFPNETRFSDESDIEGLDIQVTEIDFNGKSFSPATVSIKLGDIVIFRNKSQQDFWPASSAHPTHSEYPEFDAKAAIAPGKSFDFKFTKLGTWKFHDHLSPSSTGSIIVSE